MYFITIILHFFHSFTFLYVEVSPNLFERADAVPRDVNNGCLLVESSVAIEANSMSLYGALIKA